MSTSILIGNRAYTSPKSVLSVDAKVELVQKEGARPSYKDIIFFQVNHYKDNKLINLQISPYDLRTMCEEVRELILTGKSRYDKRTASGKTKKQITLGCQSDKGDYFINLKEKSIDGTNEVKVEHIFKASQLKAFIATMELLCDRLESRTFAYQEKLSQEKIRS